jgi:hypothetical protein
LLWRGRDLVCPLAGNLLNDLAPGRLIYSVPARGTHRWAPSPAGFHPLLAPLPVAFALTQVIRARDRDYDSCYVLRCDSW